MNDAKPMSPADSTIGHNVQDALSYLDQVKSHLGADDHVFGLFLAELGKWLDIQDSSLQTWTACLLQIVSLLRFNPVLLHGLTSLLASVDQRLECSTTVDEVKYFVLCSPAGAKIFSTAGSELPIFSTDDDLQKIVCSRSNWNTFLRSNPEEDLLKCISQLLQEIMDNPATNPAYARQVYRCQRELVAKSILPPSIFVNNVQRGDGQAVQGGAFADIYKGEMMSKPVCLRVLRMFDTPEENRDSVYKDFCSEVLVWRQLRHPNILPFFGANLEIFSPRFCFVSPWMHNGDIMSFLKQHPDHDRFRSIREIVEGIEYLHGLDPPVTHKDIKGTNVLVKDDFVCCLADFGLASIVESQDLGHSPAFQGSVCWMAPELFDPALSPPTLNPRAGDIYALACTIYEIYTGRAPFLDTKKATPAIILAVLKGERPRLPPGGSWTIEEEQLWWLVGLCWKQKLDERPEIRLIKNVLSDLGGGALKTSHTGLLMVPTSEGHRSDVGGIKAWLEKEKREMAAFFPVAAEKALVEEGVQRLTNVGILFETEVQLGKRPKRQDSDYIPSSRQKPLVLPLTSTTRPTTFSSRGLLTPLTPSTDLTDLEPASSPGPEFEALPNTLIPLSGKLDAQSLTGYQSRDVLHTSEASKKAQSDALLSKRGSFPTPPSTPVPTGPSNGHKDHSRVLQNSESGNIDGPKVGIRVSNSTRPSLFPKEQLLPSRSRQSHIKYGSRPLPRRHANIKGSPSFTHNISPLSQVMLAPHGPTAGTGDTHGRPDLDTVPAAPSSK